MKKTGRKIGRKKRVLFFAGFFVLYLVSLLGIWKEYAERDYRGEEIICEPNSFISWEERVREEYQGQFADCLQGLENGDILLTPCSHTFGWRNGHAAIVIDEETGETLESVVIGTDSCVQNLSKWRKYPGVAVLRLKNASKEERNAIAVYAKEHMQGISYGFRTDFMEHMPEKWRTDTGDTHCAHLIWSIYRHFGYDIDGDGGIWVTPKDIFLSPCLEIVERYHVDIWKRE